ncbi:hypothetical protein [Microlunatus sp. GCM10028923]|uniref:hypothetical protein n=1 Tax=Microlunatus sp. GCM10028923 TaxID=3273400 RepID=UPI003610089A
MSDLEQLKQALYQVASSAQQTAGGLGDFKQNFSQHSAQIESLISGTSTGADRQLVELLDGATKAIEAAAQALDAASSGCTSYADQI